MFISVLLRLLMATFSCLCWFAVFFCSFREAFQRFCRVTHAMTSYVFYNCESVLGFVLVCITVCTMLRRSFCVSPRLGCALLRLEWGLFASPTGVNSSFLMFIRALLWFVVFPSIFFDLVSGKFAIIPYRFCFCCSRLGLGIRHSKIYQPDKQFLLFLLVLASFFAVLSVFACFQCVDWPFFSEGVRHKAPLYFI